MCGGSEHTGDDNEIVILHKKHLQERDPTIAAVFDLPIGWEARRENGQAPWTRTEFVEEDDE
jgi:hypothetical protein